MRHPRHTSKWAMAAVTAAIVATACGARAQSTSPTAAPSAAVSTPVATASPAGYAASLIFTGGLAGTVSGAQAPLGGASNACGGGAVDVNVVFKGQNWGFNASASSYHGPGQYTVGSDFSLLIASPTNDLWFSTGGTASYKSDKSLSIDVDVTNMMAGPGEPGSAAHIAGTFSCG